MSRFRDLLNVRLSPCTASDWAWDVAERFVDRQPALLRIHGHVQYRIEAVRLDLRGPGACTPMLRTQRPNSVTEPNSIMLRPLGK